MLLLCKNFKVKLLFVLVNIFACDKFVNLLLKENEVILQFELNIVFDLIILFWVFNDWLESRSFVTDDALSVLIKMRMASDHIDIWYNCQHIVL